MMNDGNRLFLAVDVQSLFYKAKAAFGDVRVNYEALSELALDGRRPVSFIKIAYIFSKRREDGKRQNDYFVERLVSYGYRIRDDELVIDKRGRPILGCNSWGVGVTIDAIEMLSEYDTFILAGGGDEFYQLLQHLIDLGKKVELITFRNSLSQRLAKLPSKILYFDRCHTFARPVRTDDNTRPLGSV